MTLSISELARLEDELGHWIGIVTDLRRPKSTREEAYREVRKIERQLGLEPKDYVH